MKPLAALHRLKRRVRVLTAQKRRLVYELRAARAVLFKPTSPNHAAPPSTIPAAS